MIIILMLMKKFILLLCLLFVCVFSVDKKLFAKEIEANIENKNSAQIEEIKPNNKKDISKSSIKDIFGDEQTFPFVAGLGKNAAH